MRRAGSIAALVALALFGGACKGGDEDDAGVDAGNSSDEDTGVFADAATDDATLLDLGPTDADSPDLASPDAADAGDLGPADSGDSGVLDPCPSGTPACARAADCEADISPPSNCGHCVPFNESLCATGACDSPPVLGASDLYNVVITTAPNIPELSSLSAFAVSSRTAGGLVIDCDDVYAGRVDLQNRCYNVLLTRAYVISQPGQSFSVGFVSFTSSEHTLFVIYGHTDTQARTAPVGLSCTEHDVPAPTSGGPYFVSGDAMRRI